MLERRDTSEPMHVGTCTYIFVVIQSRAISSRGDYSRATSIAYSGAATIRERRLFESGVYSTVAVYIACCHCHGRC